MLHGVVRDAVSGEPLSGALLVTGPVGSTAITDSRGQFSLRWKMGTVDSLHVRFIGYRPLSLPIQLGMLSGEPLLISLTPSPVRLDAITISATREARDRGELPLAVDRLDAATIERLNPAHPSRIANRIPGVWINATEGEGHMTAIRQPLSLLPQYLFLENGIPTRSTGFFNHNALFEVNLAQASALEIIKGPGTALYGSDAIGGVINIETGAIPSSSGGSVTAEGGSFGFRRLLATGASVGARNGFRGDVNWTMSDGWRRGTSYDRFSSTLSWQHTMGGAGRVRTVASYTNVQQHPAGIAAISTKDYETDPRTHYTPVSYRNVTAVRVSSAFEFWTPNSMWSVTPFFRYSRMDLIPNWALAFDPAIWEVHNFSLGTQLRYRQSLPSLGLSLIGGADLDVSPGRRTETEVIPERVDGLFVAVTPTDLQYDYDVTFGQMAPYVHAEWQAVPRLMLNGGLRLDLAMFDYTNRLSVVEGGSHQRPPSQRVTYSHLSPKLGGVFQASESFNVFASWRHAFRVPDERQVFRQGAARSSIGLRPVRADNIEASVRWQKDRVGVDVTAFSLRKGDDIVTFNYADGSRGSVNTGETLHRGLETGVRVDAGHGLTAEAAWTLSRHTFEEWVTELDQDYSGNEMDVAPRHLLQAEVSWTAPWLEGIEWGLEVHRVGSYWMNPENTVRYEGHLLLHARVHAQLTDRWLLLARIENVTDRLYAQRALTNAFRGDEWAPGLPRSFNLALRASF